MDSPDEIFHQKTDYKRIIMRFLRYKYYFIATVIVALIIAFFINKFSQRVYSNWTSLLIKEEQRNSFLSAESIMDIGLFSGIENVENELAVLKSFSIINQTVQEMNIEVSYIMEENLLPVDFLKFMKKTDLYKNSPIQVILDQTHIQPVSIRFDIDIINDSIFKLSALNEEKTELYNYVSSESIIRPETFHLDGVFKFGEKITSPDYSFTIYLQNIYLIIL